jgi:octaprenyl-diphosphate synthase
VSGTINEQPVQEALQSLYAPVATDLAEVEKILKAELRNEHPFVDEMVRYGCLLGGKRLRPALLLLSAQATGQVNREHWMLAAAVEMIHTATLVHDDVLDEADQRRHLATVNARWDNEASVLLGDYLFTHAFYLASTVGSHACRTIGRSTNLVCEGELRQIGSRADYSLSEDNYLAIIEGKTAELCACACQLGAHYACADETVTRNLGEYGRCLGIAFQIADDLLDVIGDQDTAGKSLGTDLEKRKPTLPLIRVLELADERDRTSLMTLLGNVDAPTSCELIPYFEKYDAINYSREKALSFAEHARTKLESLTTGPAQQILEAITEFVVMRSA